MLLSALSVCPALHIFLLFYACIFCVCHYILCHLYYYLILVRLDCTFCVCKVYLVCIVCGHWGPLSPDHLCGSHDYHFVSFQFYAIYFIFFLLFICLDVFILVRV